MPARCATRLRQLDRLSTSAVLCGPPVLASHSGRNADEWNQSRAMTARVLRFIDLFAGLGGFHVGLQRLGHRCVFACEKEPALRSLYANNFGIQPFPDVRDLKPSSVPQHDVLCAGFPCQPFSKAGEQLGLCCERDGDLFNYILRLLRFHRPRFFILENVANLLRHDHGETYAWMRRSLENLGYDVSHALLSPHNYGIPQIRLRAFIVGSRDGLNGFDWPDPIESAPNIRDVLDRRPKKARPLPPNYEKCISVWQDFLDRIPKDSPLPSFPIWSFEYGATYPVDGAPPALRRANVLARSCGAFGMQLRGMSHDEQLSNLPSYARSRTPFPKWKRDFIVANREFFERHRKRLKTWVPLIQEFAPSLQKLEWNCQGEPRVIRRYILQFRASGVRVKRPNWAPALIAMTTTQIPVIGWESRYMTTRECARLQGLGHLRLNGTVSSAVYRAIGNAVSADLVQLVAARLLPCCGPTRLSSSVPDRRQRA